MTTTPTTAKKAGKGRRNLRDYAPAIVGGECPMNLEGSEIAETADSLRVWGVPHEVTRAWMLSATRVASERHHLESELHTLIEKAQDALGTIGRNGTPNSLGVIQGAGGFVDASCGRYTAALEAYQQLTVTCQAIARGFLPSTANADKNAQDDGGIDGAL